MATTNNSSQTNTFQSDGYTQVLNYYQVVLTAGNRVIMGSNIYSNHDDVDKVVKELGRSDIQYAIKYVTAVPNMSYLNSHLQRNYRTDAGFYCPPPQAPSTPNQPIPDPELN